MSDNGNTPAKPARGNGSVRPDDRSVHHYRVAEIQARLSGDGPKSSDAARAPVVEVSWQAEASPAPRADLHDPVAGLPEGWTAHRLPARSLIPTPGYGAAGQSVGDAVMFVALFGLPRARAEAVLRRIERRHVTGLQFRPVFLTDLPDLTAPARAGFVCEVLPAEIYGGPEATAAFAQRFRRLWQKWNGTLLLDFSAPGFMAARLEDLEAYTGRPEPGRATYSPRLPKPAIPPEPVTDVVALRAEYEIAGLDREADTFVLYRVLGNDLPPRHEVGQTQANLRFILENEPPLADCEKRWVLNRIRDPEQEEAILALLAEHDQPVLRIPFDLKAYAQAEWDLTGLPDDAFFLRGRYAEMDDYGKARAEAHVRRHKNNYAVNNNGARNAALEDGKGRAKWVLPWDGNCFVTAEAWEEIRQGVVARPYMKYFVVPMSRTLDNADLLDPDYRPEADAEPQILFRRDTTETFDPAYPYGRRPKVELFYRLGVRGPWDTFSDDVWDLPRPARSGDAGSVARVGWVARLFSGQTMLETEETTVVRTRGQARIAAVSAMLDDLDVRAMSLTYRPEALTAYDENAIAGLPDALSGSPERDVRDALLRSADLALQRGPHSVIRKTELPPSGDAHDYYHPAPYWWPNPATATGEPFVFRDGERVPGTRLYEVESDRYDRTRLQWLFDDTTALALAWRMTGNRRYADHAADLIRTWFLDPATRMNPHLRYAQVRSRLPDATGVKSGVIEMKDLYYMLDAVRLIERSGALTDPERAAFRDWLRTYLEWLQTSDQGREERLTRNNHGTCFDLQVASIAAFLGDVPLLARTFFTSRERILEQFTAEGQQPHEMARTQTAHYCAFNLQCWVNLATLAEACGHDLWSFEGEDGRGMARAFAWLLPHLGGDDWTFPQIEPFDWDRLLPLYFTARDRIAGQLPSALADPAQVRPVFFAHDGIKPFWMLGRRSASKSPRTPAWSALGDVLVSLDARVADRCAPVDAPCTDLPVLERRLAAGFSDMASRDLERLRDDDTAGAAKRMQAARALARWAFRRGDPAGSLENLGHVTTTDARSRRDLSLARALCLLRMDRSGDALSALERAVELFPKDTHLRLALADACLAEGDDERWRTTMNEVFRTAGMAPIPVQPGDADGHGLNGAGPEGGGRCLPGSVPAQGNGTPRVSVVLVVPPGARPAGRALNSIRAQTRTDIELLVVDLSGCAETRSLLDAALRSDSRLRVLNPGRTAAVHDALNHALAEARGDYICTHQWGEVAHHAKIELQLAAVERTGIGCVLATTARFDDRNRIRAVWDQDPALFEADARTLMARTETIRGLAGWDAVATAPWSALLWRLERYGGPGSVASVGAGVPLSLVFEADDPAGSGRAVGLAQTDLDRLAHLAAGATDIGEPLPPLGAMAAPAPDPFDHVFVGDFSEGADAIDRIRSIVVARCGQGAEIGLFHWPDPDSLDGPGLDARIAALLEEGRLRRIAPFDAARARRVTVTNPYILASGIDGLPDFDATEVEVIAGPEFDAARIASGRSLAMPSLAEMKSVLGKDFAWRALVARKGD